MTDNDKSEEITQGQEEKVFQINEILPSSSDAFLFNAENLIEAIKDCDIVLDTNVLLMPYNSGSETFKKIINIYAKYKKENRIFLPGQVAREFIKNRPNKISELYHSLSDKVSRISIPEKILYPILEGNESYKKINEKIDNTNKLKREIIQLNSDILSEIQSWEWNDPVYKSYKDIFTPETIKDIHIDNKSCLQELEHKYRLGIPPGYKDNSKGDNGIGDLLIWKTILQIGSENKKHLIFVSGEEKADWQHRTNNFGLMPRFELLDEYRRCSENKTFFIIQLSRFLELSDIESAIVNEVKQEEKRVANITNVDVECPTCGFKVNWKLDEFIGSSAMPRCTNCGEVFILRRTQENIEVSVIHNAKSQTGVPKATETIICPYCHTEQYFELGIYPVSTNWCTCINCKKHFPVHRLRDGTIKISVL
jgi:rRNA-processing protein FCF1